MGVDAVHTQIAPDHLEHRRWSLFYQLNRKRIQRIMCRKGPYFFWFGFLSANHPPLTATLTPTTAPSICFQPMPASLPIPITSAASDTISNNMPKTINTTPIVLLDIDFSS